MKFLLVIAALFIAGVMAQGHLRPQLDSSFTATANFVERHGNRGRHFQGTWYMDSVGRQERINGQTKIGQLDFFRFWNQSLDYEFQPKSGACQKQTVPGQFYAPFGWLHLAKENGSCKQVKSGEQGVAWKWTFKNGDMHMELDLCVDEATGKIPYWEQMIGKDRGNEFHRFADFRTYTPGVPDPSTFQLPAQCNKIMF